MRFQSLIGTSLALAATTATASPITDQKPILSEYDDLTTQQVDLIKEYANAKANPQRNNPNPRELLI